MSSDVTMPRLSDTMEEGTLVAWRVKVGDKVVSGDILADIETGKQTVGLEAHNDGTVAKLNVDEGAVAPVGQVIMMLAEEGENIDDSAAGGHARISPVARKIADEHSIDPAAITGTGPDGQIIKRDILAAIETFTVPATTPAIATPSATPEPSVPPGATGAEKSSAPTTQPLEARTIPLTNMRKVIARRLVESKTTIPHFTVTVAVAMDGLLDVRRQTNAVLEAQGVKLSVNDFIVGACARALIVHPLINASWSGDSITQHGTVNIGVAVALPAESGGGLVVPTIRDAQTKSLSQISVETRALAEKSRSRQLSAAEMADGTFTISNLGMLGVDHFEAIINPPQGAILAVGAALEKPIVRDGRITVGHEMTNTMSCDHRVIDGAMAAEFLQTLKQLLESPAELPV